MRPMAWNTSGANCPRAIPATMHAATHTLRYRSKLLMAEAAAAWLAVSGVMALASLVADVAQLAL